MRQNYADFVAGSFPMALILNLSEVVPSSVSNNSSLEDNIVFLSEKERTILTVVFLLLFLFGIVSNLIVIFTIFQVGNYADVPTNIFILSQAFSDLGTASAIPIYISHMYIWNWNLFYLYTGLVWLASLGSLFLMTFNRFVSVVWSLHYTRHMTPFRARLLVAANWTLAVLVALWQVLDILDPGVYPNFGRYYIVVLVLCVLSCVGYMYRESRVQARKIKHQNRLVTGLQKNLREDFRSVRTVTLVGGSFLLSCLPFTLVVFAYGDDKMSVRFQRNAAFWGPLMAINSVLDPMIYYFRSGEFRSFYKRFESRLRGRNLDIRQTKRNAPLFVLFNEKRRVKPCF